nr:hypothetical protein [Tanacetum cinerariifolium]
MQIDSNKEIRTEIDEEQQTDTNSTTERSEQRQVHSTKLHKYGDEREQVRCIAQNHINTEMHGSRSGRQQQIQIDNSKFRHTVDNIHKIQTTNSDRVADQTPDSDSRFLGRCGQTEQN